CRLAGPESVSFGEKALAPPFDSPYNGFVARPSKQLLPRLFLETAFSADGYRNIPARDLLAGADELRIRHTTLREAKRALGIRAVKSRGLDGEWVWTWPEVGAGWSAEPAPITPDELLKWRRGLLAFGWKETRDGRWQHYREPKTYSATELTRATFAMVLVPGGSSMAMRVFHALHADLVAKIQRDGVPEYNQPADPLELCEHLSDLAELPPGTELFDTGGRLMCAACTPPEVRDQLRGLVPSG
ncbi:MAG: hypothetical protein ACRDQZ_16150, partial [Mycobacteriales bacterium]